MHYMGDKVFQFIGELFGAFTLKEGTSVEEVPVWWGRAQHTVHTQQPGNRTTAAHSSSLSPSVSCAAGCVQWSEGGAGERHPPPDCRPPGGAAPRHPRGAVRPRPSHAPGGLLSFSLLALCLYRMP